MMNRQKIVKASLSSAVKMRLLRTVHDGISLLKRKKAKHSFKHLPREQAASVMSVEEKHKTGKMKVKNIITDILYPKD